MADLRTTVTEVVTGAGMLDFDDVEAALAARPDVLTGVGPDVWDDLQRAWKEGQHLHSFVAAFQNGRAFRAAHDALRGRVPALIEWTGMRKAPGDEVVPADLRVDHVYLVSCKYLSRIVVNASPHHLFDRLLAGGYGRRGTDWFKEVAAREYQTLYNCVRGALPADPAHLDAQQRRELAYSLRRSWPTEAEESYAALVERTAVESAARWRAALKGHGEAMLWRLLRVGSAPYFVLGVSGSGFVRLRIATPWDWRRAFELRHFEVAAKEGGQPVVAWSALIRNRADHSESTVAGHVEIRWSHGRFRAPPEAKVYLDTPATAVAGYFALQ
jgi:hypothetical protein